MTLQPAGFVSAAAIHCDMEVGGDGDGTNFLDESNVDGTDNSTGEGLIGGLLTTALNTVFGAGYVDMTDGTWDDGGIGGACHGTAYDKPEYNHNVTGCGGNAHAEDIVMGGDVWIGAGCDWFSWANDPLDPMLCLTTLVATQNEAGILRCIQELHASLLTPVADVAVVVCGSNGVADGLSYGAGGGDFPSYGVPYSGNATIEFMTPECAPTDAALAAYVDTYIGVAAFYETGVEVGNVDLPGGGSFGDHPCNIDVPIPCPGEPVQGIELGVPLAGWIDWMDWSNAIEWHAEIDSFIIGVGPDACRDDINNDLDTEGTDEVDLDGNCDSDVIGPLQPCSNGIDEDGDGVTDDIDCDQNSLTTGEEGNAVPKCADGIDNDGDELADNDDPECHDDGDAGNALSYIPTSNAESGSGQVSKIQGTIQEVQPPPTHGCTKCG